MIPQNVISQKYIKEYPQGFTASLIGNKGQIVNDNILYNLQLVFLIDKSGSMRTKDKDPLGENDTGFNINDGWTRYDNVCKFLAKSIEGLMEYDFDKRIPICFFGNSYNSYTLTNINTIRNLKSCLARNYPTDETTNLKDSLDFCFYENEKLNNNIHTLYVIFTDGCPNDSHTIKPMIQRHIKTNDKFNILFIRVGDDVGAINFLKNLDDDKDIGEYIDTKSDNCAYIFGMKNLLLNAIYEHLDNDNVWKTVIEENL